MIAENKKYIGFKIDVVLDSYTDASGELKAKKIQLIVIDRIW